ncbi:hypothetical protein R5M17_001483 [Proteus mirabilis]|uniref:hypothetical protein n=1 Tax=Proteus mirabilis TaxID=584 RepID=UPI000E06793E|nr:hypothetical protein [Proteus mirabilis]EHF3471530.1 hypothetical protein [Proteus mirabilis]EKV9969042.1 hypothetical protein [Proteus mirabilis]EKW2668164.1 hypothetical protein [Proteus mirabilis]ELA6688174.1 hypothetical protein [Proteus mirabilis]ELS4558321.1 hypothetical protein [Proteus mirabilis]
MKHIQMIMFESNNKTYLISESDVISSYPVRALKCDCLITKSGREYNATNIKKVYLDDIDGILNIK